MHYDTERLKSHHNEDEKIVTGSFFTPKKLVTLVYEMIKDYITEETYIGDFGAGYGSFLDFFSCKHSHCFGTEIDDESYKILQQNFKKNVTVFHENSLLNISRKKYNLSPENKLIIIGNPPYNDVTSKYKKGKKGTFQCDDSVTAKDIGISFLKLYNQLKANFICILHPFSYLIKKANFESLRSFKDNYKLINGYIFSSKMFSMISSQNHDFPIVAALYERNNLGMNYNYIKSFKFNVLDQSRKFCLSSFNTIDGIVNKYPRKNMHNGLQFYTLRDINALLRNATFVEGNISNGVEINIKNLYQYAWLFYFKNNFNAANNMYLYGNLSPLYPEHITNQFKNECISYAFNNPLVQKYFSKHVLEKEYGKLSNSYETLKQELNKFYIF